MDTQDVVGIEAYVSTDKEMGEVGCGPMCKVNYLSTRGKNIQLARMLCSIFIPLACVWGFTIFSLYDNTLSLYDYNTDAKVALQIVIRMGRLIHKLQKERDMTILHVGKLGPGTKAFLLKNYEETDEAFANMEVWPEDFANNGRPEFSSKNKLLNYISSHRKHLDTENTNTVEEIKFYTDIANLFVTWMIENIRDTGFGSFWKSLVAYQKLTRCSLDAGAERAYGVMFFTKGGFSSWEELELYNKRIHSFKIHYSTAVSYSPLVKPLLDDDANEIDATVAVNAYRAELRRSEIRVRVENISLDNAEWLFDNMTIRIDSLFDLQEQIAEKITAMLQQNISEIVTQIAIYGVIGFLTIGVCPLILASSYNLTSNIAQYSRILFEKTAELDKEKDKSEAILYEMIPKQIVERLKKKSKCESEFFRSVTLMFSSIVGFTKLTQAYSAIELVELLSHLYTIFDRLIDSYDLYKVETINDTYFVVSGLPMLNGDRHAAEIAYFAVHILKMLQRNTFSESMNGNKVQLQIGISTGTKHIKANGKRVLEALVQRYCLHGIPGPVSAGIIGTVMLRYCVFGDTVNIASRMMTHGAPNRIQISQSTYKKLKKTDNFKIQSRGAIAVKGKGNMNTFWLLDTKEEGKPGQSCPIPGHTELVRHQDSSSSTYGESPRAEQDPEALAYVKHVKSGKF